MQEILKDRNEQQRKPQSANGESGNQPDGASQQADNQPPGGESSDKKPSAEQTADNEFGGQASGKDSSGGQPSRIRKPVPNPPATSSPERNKVRATNRPANPATPRQQG